MLPTWDNIVSLSVIGLYAVPFFLALAQQNVTELSPFLGMLVTVGLNETIKHFLVGTASPRPSQARDCNLWGNNGPQGGRPGMPSGHSAHVSFFVGYYLQYVFSSPSSTTHRILAVLLVVYALLVMTSRYTLHCHTLPQILSGATLGFLLSVLWYRVVTPAIHSSVRP
jgi:membrane-associated phospholipid phosphatase